MSLTQRVDSLCGYIPVRLGKFLNLTFGWSTTTVGAALYLTGNLPWHVRSLMGGGFDMAISVVSIVMWFPLFILCVRQMYSFDWSDPILPMGYSILTFVRQWVSLVYLIFLPVYLLPTPSVRLLTENTIELAGLHILTMAWPRRRSWFAVKWHERKKAPAPAVNVG